jgi:hypothetical protein
MRKPMVHGKPAHNQKDQWFNPRWPRSFAVDYMASQVCKDSFHQVRGIVRSFPSHPRGYGHILPPQEIHSRIPPSTPSRPLASGRNDIDEGSESISIFREPFQVSSPIHQNEYRYILRLPVLALSRVERK